MRSGQGGWGSREDEQHVGTSCGTALGLSTPSGQGVSVSSAAVAFGKGRGFKSVPGATVISFSGPTGLN